MLKIYNSFTKSKEVFKPIKPNHVDLYVCGMTVYDFCHIGHARVLIFFDTVVRFLKYIGYKVKYVRNITDVDDKIIDRANKNQEDFTKLTDRFIQAMHEDCDSLDLVRPDIEPRATEFIQKIIDIVKGLVDKGYAYVSDNGDVYYDIKKFKNYGKLSHRNLEDLKVGARVEPSKKKNDLLDFAVWKASKPNEPGWNSPWGKGRPGWHIECSAMSTSCLENHIDIHGGGADLLFPHHENEIAQSEAYTGEKFVNIWMHVGHLQVDNQKMSKSLGNFFTIREVLENFSGEVIRYFMMSCHYRKPINYTEDVLIQSKKALESLYISLRDLSFKEIEKNTEFEKEFIYSMEDDFNTPKALSVLFDLSHEINRLKDVEKYKANKLAGLMKKLGNILGILEKNPEDFLKDTDVNQRKIEVLILKRKIAREKKNWKESDSIREELDKMGILLEDIPSGETIWRNK